MPSARIAPHRPAGQCAGSLDEIESGPSDPQRLTNRAPPSPPIYAGCRETCIRAKGNSSPHLSEFCNLWKSNCREDAPSFKSGSLCDEQATTFFLVMSRFLRHDIRQKIALRHVQFFCPHSELPRTCGKGVFPMNVRHSRDLRGFGTSQLFSTPSAASGSCHVQDCQR
jgi:hypothetical protein